MLHRRVLLLRTGRRYGGFAAAAAAMTNFLLASPTTASAFSVTGSHWGVDENGVACGNVARLPTAVWNPCVVGFFTTSRVNGHAGWQGAANAAAGDWYDFDGPSLLLFFKYDIGRANGVAVVSMDGGDLGQPINGSVQLGQATWTSSGSFTVSASTVINDNPNVTWCVSGCPQAGAWTLQQDMEHELGHALGLAHPIHDRTQGSSVMECVQFTGELTLRQPDDVNGEDYLYGPNPGSTGSPQPSPC